LLIDDNKPYAVRIGGRAVTVLEGEILINE
jgi:hypothetical protein